MAAALPPYKPAYKTGAAETARQVSAVKLALADLIEGKMPLQVMLETMRWADAQASGKLAEIEESLARRSQIAPEDHAAVVRSAFADYFELTQFRNLAHSCARDAAPYCHPKFSVVHVDQNGPSPSGGGITPDQPMDVRFISAKGADVTSQFVQQQVIDEAAE